MITKAPCYMDWTTINGEQMQCIKTLENVPILSLYTIACLDVGGGISLGLVRARKDCAVVTNGCSQCI